MNTRDKTEQGKSLCIVKKEGWDFSNLSSVSDLLVTWV